MNEELCIFTLQGPEGGQHRMESWVIPRGLYDHMRTCMERDPDLSTLHQTPAEGVIAS
jgi:hypothetical protein